MKKINFWMLAAIFSCGLLTTACGVIENPIEREYAEGEVDVFWDMPGNEGDSLVIAALLSIENVDSVKPFISSSLGQAYYFNYNQLIDHENPNRGTFKQQVVLTFVSKEVADQILNDVKELME